MMALVHEWMFYEVMWRLWTRGSTYPTPWWVAQTLGHWSENYDTGLFDSREAAFASNALYRYWSMVGVTDATRESLVGQAGEIEPVYDQYATCFFLFDPAARRVHLPQRLGATPGATVEQSLESGYRPVVLTTFYSAMGVVATQTVLATQVGPAGRVVTLARLRADNPMTTRCSGWLCVGVLPAGPSGFQRHDRAGRYLADGRLSFLRYLAGEQRLDVNRRWGPAFDSAPAHWGLYGNAAGTQDPEQYLSDNPFANLEATGDFNGAETAGDYVGGLCHAAFGWPFALDPGETFTIDMRLPVDDFRTAGDLADLRATPAADLEAANRASWVDTLDRRGLQIALPQPVAHLFDLFRVCRANLLMLADDGEIHPGPTIYDSFWIRDSSVEAIACALAGDGELADRQLSDHYPARFRLGADPIGPVSSRGFFGGEHEVDDHEWDSNGEALWAFGRFDRIAGRGRAFGAGVYFPFVVDGARWIRDNRDQYGLLHSGWSAEHLGDRDQPHYWDDFWSLAGLYEAARLGERLQAAEVKELWAAFDDLKSAIAASIRWALDEQRRGGAWQTFIPTGPGNVGELDSTIVGALAYFHPCRLYMGQKLGSDVDTAARLTLETIWSNFTAEEGGFRHDHAWRAYGAYLTLQLAHAFLFVGDRERMDRCLAWAVGDAAYARVTRFDEAGQWQQVALGAWNEQHCYPVATDFERVPDDWWYMGDIPHGWAAAEFNLLLRDILLFEADEDADAHIFIAPGVMPHWLQGGGRITVTNAPTLFGVPFGYTLAHDPGAHTVTIDIADDAPPSVRFVYPCQFGSVTAATVDGADAVTAGDTVMLPAGSRRAAITYA
jgi:hypothetical protein